MAETKDNKAMFNERLERINKAIRLEPTDRLPMAPFFASWVQRSQGSSYRDIYYDQESYYHLLSAYVYAVGTKSYDPIYSKALSMLK